MLSSTDVEGLSEWLSCKEFACNIRDMGSISRSARSPGGENSNPLQYSYLKNPMDRETRQNMVQRVWKSQIWLSD